MNATMCLQSARSGRNHCSFDWGKRIEMRTETPVFIATESILWLRSDGTEIMIEAKIGAPYMVDETSWACPACLEGVDGRYPDIVGAGSLQALVLTIRLIGRRLGHMIDENAQLVYPGDRSAWDLSSHGSIFEAAGKSR
jgi:hypothetical protein